MSLDLYSIRHIGVLRALQLGDMLCAIPAIRALRAACPQAEITLIGLPWAESFVKRFDKYFDEFMHFPGYIGLPEQEFSEGSYMKFLGGVRKRHFDLVLQMQGDGTIVNDLLSTWNAKHVAGFYNMYSDPHSDLFMEYPTGIPEVRRHLSLMTHLGISWIDDGLEFVIKPGDKKELELTGIDPFNTPYVCIHPGSRATWRQWPPKLFARVGDVCAEAGLKVVITGTKDEADITSSVKQKMKHPSIDVTGKTSLGAMGLLLRNARLLVSNCTGVSHIAAATQTPSVIISMDGEPERWGPLNRQLHHMVDCRRENKIDEVVRSVRSKLSPFAYEPSLRISQAPLRTS